MEMFHPLSKSENNLLEITSGISDLEDMYYSSRPTTPAPFTGTFVTTGPFENVEMNQEPELPEFTTIPSVKNKTQKEDKKIDKFKKALKKAAKRAEKSAEQNQEEDTAPLVSSGPQASPPRVPAANVPAVSKAPKKYDPAGNLITTTTAVPGNTVDENDDIPEVTPTKGVSTAKEPNQTTEVPSNVTAPLFTSTDRISDSLSSVLVLQTTTPSTTDSTDSVFTDNTTVVSSTSTVDPVTKTSNNDTQGNFNIIIIGGKKKKDKKDKMKKKMKKLERLRLCSNPDFNSIPGGKKCCMKSAKCFQDLPDDLDEFDNQQNSEDFDAANVCREIDDALLCMSNVFINFDCHETADIVNRNLKTELQTVRKIYSGHCTGIPKQTTTVAGTDNLGNQNQSAAVSNDNLPTSALIGVAVGGLLFVAIFILVLVWLRSRRKPRDTESNKVVFENCSDDSSRYKSFTRRNSDVYAEIDDHALARSINLNNNKDVTQTGDEDTGLRPLPNAPSTQLTADDHGYLTPESTRRERAEESGYDQLARDMRNSRCLSQTYDKLESENGEMIAKSESRNSPEEDGDGEYITPPGKDPSPKQTSQTEENYHMYFVLEKQAGSSPT